MRLAAPNWLPAAPPAGSSTVLQQEVGDEPAWWQTLLRAMLGQWLQGWIG